MGASKLKEMQIKKSLADEAMMIEPSNELFNKIRKDIYEKECNETMKNKSWKLNKGKKLGMVTALCIAIGSVTVIGATIGRSWVGHIANNTYMSFPAVEKVKEDVGFAPKYTEELPGGFKYSRGGIGESQLMDESGAVLTSNKQVTFMYKGEDKKLNLSLDVTKIEEKFVDHTASKLVGEYNGIQLYYYEQDYKFVPESYKLTEEDKAAQASGKLEISIGASEVSCENIQSINWYEGGMEYTIIGNDYHFDVEQMIAMAKTIIDQK